VIANILVQPMIEQMKQNIQNTLNAFDLKTLRSFLNIFGKQIMFDVKIFFFIDVVFIRTGFDISIFFFSK